MHRTTLCRDALLFSKGVMIGAAVSDFKWEVSSNPETLHIAFQAAALITVIGVGPKALDYAFSKLRAIEDYSQAIRLAPSFAVAFYRRGVLERQMGTTRAGDEDIARARKIDRTLGK